jgi:hypothetical protein
MVQGSFFIVGVVCDVTTALTALMSNAVESPASTNFSYIEGPRWHHTRNMAIRFGIVLHVGNSAMDH